MELVPINQIAIRTTLTPSTRTKYFNNAIRYQFTQFKKKDGALVPLLPWYKIKVKNTYYYRFGFHAKRYHIPALLDLEYIDVHEKLVPVHLMKLFRMELGGYKVKGCIIIPSMSFLLGLNLYTPTKEGWLRFQYDVPFKDKCLDSRLIVSQKMKLNRHVVFEISKDQYILKGSTDTEAPCYCLVSCISKFFNAPLIRNYMSNADRCLTRNIGGIFAGQMLNISLLRDVIQAIYELYAIDSLFIREGLAIQLITASKTYNFVITKEKGCITLEE